MRFQVLKKFSDCGTMRAKGEIFEINNSPRIAQLVGAKFLLPIADDVVAVVETPNDKRLKEVNDRTLSKQAAKSKPPAKSEE